MPKIRDNLTGDIFEVDESQLWKYGLSEPEEFEQPSPLTTPTPQMQVTPSALGAETKPTSIEELLRGKQTQPTQVNPMQQIFQQAWQQAPTIKDQEKISSNWKNAFGYELFGKSEEAITEEDKKKAETDLRKELRQETKDLDFKEIRGAYDRVTSVKSTAAGDLSLIFAYMKLLDPRSVVRESEFRTAETAQTLINRFGLPLTADRAVRLYKGERLSPEARQDFVNQATLLYNQYAKRAQDVSSFYSDLARQQNLNPKNVIGALGDIKPIEVPETLNGETPAKASAEGLGGAITGLGGGAANLLFGNILKLPQTLPESVKIQKETAPRTLGEALNPFRAISGYLQSLKPVVPAAVELGLLMPALAGILGRGGITGISKAVTSVKPTGIPQPQGIGQKAVSIVDLLRSKTPRALAGKAQAEAAYKSTATPAIDKLLEVGKKAAQQDPDIAKEFVKQKSYIGKIKDIPTLLDRMETWGRTAYLKGGGIKSSAKASLYDDLYKEGLNQLKTSAPEVYKNRQLLRYTFELPKAAGKALWKATLGKLVFSGI